MTLKQFIRSPLPRLIAGLIVVVSLVGLAEMLRSVLLDQTNLSTECKAGITGLLQIILAPAGYMVLYRRYENRRINELATNNFFRYSLSGLSIGFGIQSAIILLLFFAGIFA